MSTDIEEREHALLSPSSAYTWIECKASIAAQIGQPDESSEFADEGTAAHELMKWCLDSNNDATAYMGRVIPVGTVTLGADETTGEQITAPRRTFEVDEEMASFVQVYVDGVRERIAAYELAGATVTLLVEQRLSIEHITGEKGAKGTTDTLLIAVWVDGRAEICVIDLKYGRGVAVFAENNYQALMYAAAAFNEHSEFTNFDGITIVIHQPRISEKPSEWAITPIALSAWVDDVAKPAAESALLYVDTVEFAGLTLSDFNPGEKQCRFCKAKAVCPALVKHVEDTLGADFEAISDMTDVGIQVVADLLDNTELGNVYESLDLIDSWAKAVRGRIEHELLNGNPVPGVKLVQGRRGHRQWSSVDEAEALLKSMRLKQEQMYNFKVVSPTQAEKLLAKDSPRRWKKAEALIVQRDGAPSVAPESDKRPALVIAPLDEGFGVVELVDDGSDLA